MPDITYQLITRRRSIRRFKPEKVPYRLLKKAVDAGRVAPSARNAQPLEYIIVDEQELVGKMFSLVKFAGYLDWNPGPEEMPRAYIVVVSREDDAYTKYDVGLAIENIILASGEEGIGSCLVGAFKEKKVRQLLSIPENYNVHLLVALGYPAEKPVLEEMKSGEDSIKYWQDREGTIHVPKKPLNRILHRNKF